MRRKRLVILSSSRAMQPNIHKPRYRTMAYSSRSLFKHVYRLYLRSKARGKVTNRCLPLPRTERSESDATRTASNHVPENREPEHPPNRDTPQTGNSANRNISRRLHGHGRDLRSGVHLCRELFLVRLLGFTLEVRVDLSRYRVRAQRPLEEQNVRLRPKKWG